MIHKKIGIILLLITLLPALIYTAYEITSINDNEKLIDEIYQQQMNIVLYSSNQYSWDIANNWIKEINSILNQPNFLRNKNSQDFFTKNNMVKAIFITDSIQLKHQLLLPSNKKNQTDYNINYIKELLQTKNQLINRLIHRKKVGYIKIEAIPYNDEDINSNDTILLLSILETIYKPINIIVIIVDSRKFITNILAPKLSDVARDEFILGIFKGDNANPIFSIGTINSNQIKLKKKMWIFPDHYLGIKLKNTSVEDIARDRFHRSLILIVILDLMLIISAIILYRSFRNEMELARMKSDFISNVSHELRTPLALIRMFAETMEMERVKSEEKKKEYYQIIGQESERLTHIINNILDFSKMDAGEKKFNFQTINLNVVVNDILRVYRFHLQNKGFELETQIFPKELLVKIDKESLAEVMVNLLDNAAKYSDSVKWILVKTNIESNKAILEIRDKGIGIHSHDQKKIFGKFYRVSSSLTHNTKGSGLGLTLVEYIIDAHDGKIQISSKIGEGSCFKILLPLVVENNDRESNNKVQNV